MQGTANIENTLSKKSINLQSKSKIRKDQSEPKMRKDQSKSKLKYEKSDSKKNLHKNSNVSKLTSKDSDVFFKNKVKRKSNTVAMKAPIGKRMSQKPAIHPKDSYSKVNQTSNKSKLDYVC